MTSTLRPPSIEPAELNWRNGVPESVRFGDVYFSRDNGLAESRYVFLNHNELPQRFRTVQAGGSFVIAESGFGTGLNFLAAWQAWREQGPDHAATLHFVSVERFPLSRQDLVRALALWPELTDLGEALVEQYPPLTRGVHRIWFDDGRVRLTLYFGDILEAWRSLEFKADAWFLDGFAPAMNPEMWLDDAIAQIRAHSRPGTTLATFTSVGRVRRALAATGFEMTKTPGFGRKREMLVGKLSTETELAEASPPASISVVGAGIAGCLLAFNLAQRGIPVTLIDASDDAGSGASGNRQGASYVKLGVEFNDQTELALTALTFSQRFYAPYRDRFWHPTGLLQLAWNEQEQDRQRRFLEKSAYPPEILQPVDREQASQLTGSGTLNGGLWFPNSGWLEPSTLCKTLSSHPLITRIFGFSVQAAVFRQGQWRITSTAGTECSSDKVVLCAGHLTPELLPGKGQYRFKRIRGQVTHLPRHALNAPRAVICGPRYLNPIHDGMAVTGATFDLRDGNPMPSEDSHQENLTELAAMLPGVLETPDEPIPLTQGRVAFRCTTHDYQPVADELTNADGNAVEGMYLFTGLGSKGLTYAPLLAEFLADRLSAQPQCLTNRLARRVESHRMHKPGAGKAESQ